MEKADNYIQEEHVNESEFFEIIKSIVYSSIGVFVFFIPINISGNTTTVIFHIAQKIQGEIGSLLKLLIVIFILLGCAKALININENKSIPVIKFISLIFIVIIFYGNKNITFVSDDTILVIEELVLNIFTTLPITSVFMTFLIDYGLLDIVESYSHKFMKTTYKMSGKTIVNILVYLFTDCFCGYFITHSMYTKGKLRENEAVMLMTSFSIGSIWLFNYICNDLDIKQSNLLGISLIILCTVNFIVCRTAPMSKKRKSYYIKTNYKERLHKKDKFKKGFEKYLENNNKQNIFKEIINNLEECFQILINLLPNIIFMLCIGDIIFRMDIVGEIFLYILDPILTILRLVDIKEISNFLSMVLFNNIIAMEGIVLSLSYTTKLMIGMVVLISGISISTNVIFIKYTNINISMKELIFIFVQRIILILTIYSLINYMLLGNII